LISTKMVISLPRIPPKNAGSFISLQSGLLPLA
jgi:hypothetical protein